MTIQPVLPLPILVPLAFLALAATGWLCACACRGMQRGLRALCVLLALCAVGSGFALLLNPGRWEQRPSSQSPLWVVALDVSASMASPIKDNPKAESRHDAAKKVLLQLEKASAGRDVRWVAVGQSVAVVESAQELAKITPSSDASPIMGALASYLEGLSRSGQMVAGVILLSDGRDTNPKEWQRLVARAGVAGCPVHVAPLGEHWQAGDIALHASHSLVHAYPGVETLLTVRVGNIRMGDRQVVVELLAEDGSLMQSQSLSFTDGEEREVSFSLEAKDGAYRVRVEPQPGEARVDNNEVRLVVRAVDAPIRVFLAEGAPYWDSKFLAQYLRGQPVFAVHSIHRLSSKRFYHIRTGDDDSSPTDTPDMPTTLAEWMGYDVIILGKGMEHLMDAGMVPLLKQWVSGQGGILVMSRGRCYAGHLEGMEELEPFVWKGSGMSEERFMPSEEESGLFGRTLPGRADPAWATLPPLDDVGDVAGLRPPTRVLAESEGGGIPMLAIRPYGLGAVVCFNGEGLWKWDFYPEARGQGNMYRKFWRSFLPWVQTTAEFMPGFDLSLHPNRSSVSAGEGVTCLLGWRGLAVPPEVKVQVISLKDGSLAKEQKAVPVPSDVLPRWECSLGALPPGEYLLRGVAGDSSQPECHFSVLSPPGEADNLHANPELLVRVAEATGGQALSLPVEESLFALPGEARATEEAYCPLWSRGEALAFISLCLGLYWLLRRRKGMP